MCSFLEVSGGESAPGSFRLLTKLSSLRWEAWGSRFLVGCQLEPLSAFKATFIPCHVVPSLPELVMKFQIFSHLESLTSPFTASFPMPAGETHLMCSFSTSESLEHKICRIFLYSVLTLWNLSKEKDVYLPPGIVALRHKNPTSWDKRTKRKMKGGFSCRHRDPWGSDKVDICEVKFYMLFLADLKPLS